ncbi:MAG: MerR family transcriptional regulator [bacterium]|nr:MerR family transcriptional regulator [Candidatus Minthenecus merdequi]
MPNEITKTYYSISEVAKITEIEETTLRFWEREIPQLNPPRSKGNTRRYRKEDIEVVKQIKFLTQTCLYSLEGVRQCLASNSAKVTNITKAANHLIKARKELLAIRRELNEITALREEMIIDNPSSETKI